MTGLSQDSLLMLLKIAIVPVMLLSILWRNRREKRRRAAARQAERQERASVRRDVVDLDLADIATLRTALARVQDGASLVSPRGQPLTDPVLRRELAFALLEAGRAQEAAPLLDQDGDDDDPRLMLCRARLYALTGEDDRARQILSRVADLLLEATRGASRGLRVHLAELLAQSLSDQAAPLSLHGSRLSSFGPLECLVLSGRRNEAAGLLDEMLSVLDAALAESRIDPEGRGGGLPRAALDRARSALSAFRNSHLASEEA